jgi:hypothetical protein
MKELLAQHFFSWVETDRSCYSCQSPMHVQSRFSVFGGHDFVIAFNRFTFKGGITRKNRTRISIPLEPFVLSNSPTAGRVTEQQFFVHTIIRHLGGFADSGHYVADVRVGLEGTWTCKNDSERHRSPVKGETYAVSQSEARVIKLIL